MKGYMNKLLAISKSITFNKNIILNKSLILMPRYYQNQLLKELKDK